MTLHNFAHALKTWNVWNAPRPPVDFCSSWTCWSSPMPSPSCQCQGKFSRDSSLRLPLVAFGSFRFLSQVFVHSLSHLLSLCLSQFRFLRFLPLFLLRWFSASQGLGSLPRAAPKPLPVLVGSMRRMWPVSLWGTLKVLCVPQLMSLAHLDTGSANSVYVSVCLSNLLPKKQERKRVNAKRQRTEVDVQST